MPFLSSFFLPIPLHSSLSFFFALLFPPLRLFLNPQPHHTGAAPNSFPIAPQKPARGQAILFGRIIFFLPAEFQEREIWVFSTSPSRSLVLRADVATSVYTENTAIRQHHSLIFLFFFLNKSFDSAAFPYATQIINSSARGSSEATYLTLLPQSFPRCFKNLSNDLLVFHLEIIPFHRNTSLLTSPELVSDTNLI